ncbi:hypothetical protein AWC04_00900 [Mycolicibacterium fallax]|uniref:DUF3054 domain-containing protein n=2 Tax=Mycolicibacterium fallax TaxID=1793 RepID=A0A1X1RNM9_MYCFA|nr:DUF3054 domain-containing protein [Mycolicibacterium fallax]ORV10160.1 hypothetical protein AWC04_00900 [Mycolicibacterium fallax]
MNSVADPTSRAGRMIVAAVVLDVVAVLVFCAVGRRSHAEAATLAGLAQTAWPFLAGAAVGWVAARAWRNPIALLPAGVSIWVATVAVGMVLRAVSGQTVAPSFIVVASIATAVLLLGWRAVAALLVRR